MLKFLLKSALLVGAAGLVLEGLKTLEEEQEKSKEFHIPQTPPRQEDSSIAVKKAYSPDLETKDVSSAQEIKDLALIQEKEIK